MDSIQDMALSLDLKLEILIVDLLDRLRKNLPSRLRGLRAFCATLVTYTLYFRGVPIATSTVATIVTARTNVAPPQK